MKAPQTDLQDIPAAFLERMAGLLGAEYSSFVASLQLPAITGLRLNTLKCSTEKLLNLSAWNLIPVPWCPAGFIVDTTKDEPSFLSPGKHPYHASGLYYLQEPSAMAVAEALAPQPGEKVLDLAAAPGGKATHLAALMGNQGLLVVNEVRVERAYDLVENLQRCGVTNYVSTVEPPERLTQKFGEYFDRVLLDAPCSGEGMFRKWGVARREWKPELVHGCALRQSGIIEQAARLVRPGGRLAYSTCTFSPEENEGMIATFLAKHPEYEPEVIQNIPGSSPSIPGWVGLPADHPVGRAIHLWPHQAPGEGHFIGLLRKNATSKSYEHHPMGKTRPSWRRPVPMRLEKSTRAIFDDFCLANLDRTFGDSRLAQVGTFLYLLPEPAPDLSELHVLDHGWLLGINQKGRFIPSHHLAMGIKKDQVRFSLILEPEDPRLAAYFRGETVPDPGEDAWVLVCVHGYPVGWAKRVQNVLKNYYPRGLRNSR